MPKNYPEISRPSVKPNFGIPVERQSGLNYNCKIKVQNNEGEPIQGAYILIEAFLTGHTLMVGGLFMGAEGYTNENGSVLHNTAEGYYILTVLAGGYMDYKEIISIKKNELITIKLAAMKNPVPGSNLTQSFFDYETTFGKVRIGLEGLRVFFEGAGKKLFMYGRAVNQTFTGTIDLSNDLTHYDPVSIASNAEIALAANPVIGGSAEIRMIGNGVNTPLFGAFVASTGSDAYDPTLNAVNKVVFYYDGTSAFYSITNL